MILRIKNRRVERLYGGRIRQIAKLYGQDWRDLLAQVVVESGGNAKALSSSGAIGLMQIKPIVLKEIKRKKINLFHPWENLWAGEKYLEVLRDRYGYETLYEQLVAYHDGPSKARRFLSRNLPSEHFYVQRFIAVRAAM